MSTRKAILITAIVCFTLCAVLVGVVYREASHCVLCEAPESDVPCMIDLHTGDLSELRITYDELSDDPSTFTFSFMDVLGNTGYCDTGVRLCRVTFPQDDLRLSPRLFCRECRKKLKCVRNSHYAVLDTVSKTVYPMLESSFAIAEYSVTVAREDCGMSVSAQINR